MYSFFTQAKKIVALVATVSILGGCAAAQVAVSKKELDVQTKTSTAIFVDPVSKSKRKVYLEVRSGVMEFDRRAFKNYVKEQFAQGDNGYQLVDEPDQAQYFMSTFVLNLEKASPTAAEAALHTGYSGPAAMRSGAAAGALVGGLAGSRGGNRSAIGGAVGVGLLGAGATLVANSFIKDVTYMLVCDVQIKERAKKGVYGRKDTSIKARVSDQGASSQSFSEVVNKKEYRTRIVTTANKANLKLEEAQDLMFEKTAYAMAGFF